MLLTVLYGCYYLFVASYYSVPNAEDYALSIAPKITGRIDAIVDLLVYFDSRYTANTLHSYNVLSYNKYRLYYFMPILCMFLLWVSSFFFLMSFSFKKQDVFKFLFWSALLLLIYLATAPSLPYAIFYMASTFTYTYPLIFWLVWVASLNAYYIQTSWIRNLTLLIGLFSLFLSFGSSELFIIINIATLFFWLFNSSDITKRTLITVSPFLIVTIASIVFSLSCPSNKFFNGNFLLDQSSEYLVLERILEFLGGNFKYFTSLLSNPLFLSSFLLIVVFNPFESLWNRIRPKRNLLLSIVSVFGFVFSLSLIFYFFLPKASEYPLRVFNVVHAVVLFYFFIVLPTGINRAFKIRNILMDRVWLKLISTFLLATCLILSGNNIAMIRLEHQSGVLEVFKGAYDEMYLEIEHLDRSTKTDLIVYLNFNQDEPRSNYVGSDLLPNRKAEEWNLALEYYFDIDELRMVNDSIFKKGVYEE